MEPGLAATLANLDTGRPEENVTAIKSAVVNYLREADSAIAIESTDYFNHSFSPDLVISWGGGSRRVFIRTDSREASLLEDLDWVVADSPLILPLTEVIASSSDQEDVGAEGGLDRESTRRGAMISSPRALEELHGDSAMRVTRLFAQAVVRGGRGLLDDARARRVSATVAEGYRGAEQADPESTAAAVASVEELVTLGEAKNVTRLLKAVWIGSGGSELAFPGATGVSGDLTSESLQFLLDLGDVGDDDFWARVAQRVDLQTLESLSIAPESDRFQSLVGQSLKRLRGRALIVTDDGNPFLEDDEIRWFARREFLGLQAKDFRAAFTTLGVDALQDVGTQRESTGLSILPLLDRLSAHGLGFSEMRFLSPSGSALAFRPAEPAMASDDAFLAELTEPLESNATVVFLVLPLGSGREILCDLRRGRAYGRTAAKFYVTEMIKAALPILRPLTIGQRNALSIEISNGETQASAGDEQSGEDN